MLTDRDAGSVGIPLQRGSTWLHSLHKIVDCLDKPTGSQASEPLYSDGFSSELGIQHVVCTARI